MVFRQGYVVGAAAVWETIEHPVGVDQSRWEEIARWFKQSPEESRGNIRFLVEEAIVYALHGVLASLDGVTEFHYVSDQPCEFTLAMRLYPDEDAAARAEVSTEIQISPTERGEDLHDLFLNLLDASRASSHHK